MTMITQPYFMFYALGYIPWVLNEAESAVLFAVMRHHLGSTTNTDIKRIAGLDMPARDIGWIMSKLRAVKLIDYRYIDTCRQARGSGRYMAIYMADPFGGVLHGEEQDLS